MRGISMLITLVALAGVEPAKAIELKDCNKITNAKRRMACLEGNITTLNTVLETSTRQLKEGLAKINPDNFIGRNSVVTMTSTFAANECLTWMSQGAEVKSRDCGGGAQFNGWTIRVK